MKIDYIKGDSLLGYVFSSNTNKYKSGEQADDGYWYEKTTNR